MSDKIYHIKSHARRTIQGQINKTVSNEADMQNYIDELQQSNYVLNKELQQALNEKRDAVRLTQHARSIAASRLKKRHKERNMKRSLQDQIVAQTQLAKHAKVILARHEHQMMSSDASQIRMKKE